MAVPAFVEHLSQLRANDAEGRLVGESLAAHPGTPSAALSRLDLPSAINGSADGGPARCAMAVRTCSGRRGQPSTTVANSGWRASRAASRASESDEPGFSDAPGAFATALLRFCKPQVDGSSPSGGSFSGLTAAEGLRRPRTEVHLGGEALIASDPAGTVFALIR